MPPGPKSRLSPLSLSARFTDSKPTDLRRPITSVARSIILLIAIIFLAGIALQRTARAQGTAPANVTPKITGSDGSTTGTAGFIGNFNSISDPVPTEFYMQRLADCSLNYVTVTESVSGSNVKFTITGIIKNYERVLHQMASLTTTAGVFAHGCPEKSTGISSRVGIATGMPQPGVYTAALIVPNGGSTTVRTRTYTVASSSATQVLQTAIPNAGGVATADLNGDGNGDLVVTNYGPFVYVMLGNSDGTFKSPVPYQIGGQSSIAAVIDDVTGDGKLDLITVSADQVITIFPGAGDGTFLSPLLPIYAGQNGSSSATPIQALITADVRGIGRKDIICSNGVVLLNNGGGTFTQLSTLAFTPTPSSTAGQPLGIATGDLNNDGKLDLVVTTGLVISTWIGKGDGTFTQGNSYASINNTGYVTVSDLDGDGNVDIYTGQANGGFYAGDAVQPGFAYALMGNGDGTFQGAASGTAAYTGTNLADVNGDGIPDLVTNTDASGIITPTFTVRLGTGKGSFTPASIITAPASFTATTSALTSPVTIVNANLAAAVSYVLADINGDGKADLVFVDNSLNAINPNTSTTLTYPAPIYFVALNHGDGTFATPVPYNFPQIAPASGYDIGVTASNLQVADINRDGKPDLILTYNATAGGPGTVPYSQGLAVILGNSNGNGTFATSALLTSTYSGSTAPTSATPPKVVSIADLNADSKPDLVVNNTTFTIATGTVSTLQVYTGKGDGTFNAPTTVASSNQYGIPAVADFNKDGKPDLAFLSETSTSQAQLNLALGNGDGTFTVLSPSSVTGGDAIHSASLAAADFDADGNIDLALIDANSISGVFYGKGTGSFTSVPNNTTIYPKDLVNVYAAGPAVAVDLNKDGKPDLLVGSTILLNLYGSAPSVLTPSITTLTASASSVTVGTSVTFTATVTTGATGTVTFLDGTTTLGTATVSSSKAAYTTSALIAGTHSITAVYSGDTTYSGSTASAVSVVVTAIPTVATTTTLGPPVNLLGSTTVTFNATVVAASGSIIPTGTVTFSDSVSGAIGTATLDGTGKATITTSTLALNVLHNITATYGGATGTTIFTGSTSNTIGLTLSNPTFALALSPTSANVVHGSSVTTTLTITPTGGVGITAQLACSGNPVNSMCSVSPGSVSPLAGSSATAVLTFQTSTLSGSLTPPPSRLPLAPISSGVALSCLSLLGLGLRRRMRLTGLLSLLLIFTATFGLLSLTACSSHHNPTTINTVTTGTYPLTVSATAGSITQTATFTVTVQ